MQQAVDRDLALQAHQPVSLQRELVCTLLARLDVLGQPGFAVAAGAEALDQLPLRPLGDVVLRLELHARGRDRRAGVLHRDRCQQPVAVAAHCLDDGLAVVLQHFANPTDGLLEHGFAQHSSRPHRFEQLVLGDHLAGVPQQVAQDFQRLSLQIDDGAVELQLERAVVELRAAELPAQRGTGRLPGRGLATRRRRVQRRMHRRRGAGSARRQGEFDAAQRIGFEREDFDRLRNVLERVNAGRLCADSDTVLDLAIDDVGERDPADRRVRQDAGRDVDAVTKDFRPAMLDVAQMDATTDLDLFRLRTVAVGFGQTALDVGHAHQSGVGAFKFQKEGVACGFDLAAAVQGHQLADHLSLSVEQTLAQLRTAVHQGAVADDVGEHDRGKAQ